MHRQRIIRERDSELVRDLIDKAIQHPTEDNRENAERAQEWFFEKHLTNWKECLPKKSKAV